MNPFEPPLDEPGPQPAARRRKRRARRNRSGDPASAYLLSLAVVELAVWIGAAHFGLPLEGMVLLFGGAAVLLAFVFPPWRRKR